MLTPDERGWLWSQQLSLWLGTWQGYGDNGEYNTWLRFYEVNGELVPTHQERAAKAEAKAVEAETKVEVEAKARAAAEARLATLEAGIARLKGQPPET